MPATIIDTDTPDYPMAIDSAEVNVEWDSGRRVLVAPFKIISGANRITLLAHLEPPNDNVTDWQLGFSGGTIVLAGIDNEPPLIFNRIAIGVRFDTDKKRVLLTQADISNGEIGIAGTGNVDYSGEAAAAARLRRHADDGVGAEADMADPDRAGSSRMGDRAHRARLAAAYRGRRQHRGARIFRARARRSRMTALP